MGIFSKPKYLSNPRQFATLLANENDITSCKTYDYVIVVSYLGTAGCVLANRLSENPQTTVLLLEAGASHEGNLFSAIPLAWPKLFWGASDWNYSTIPQKFTDDRQWYWPRGRMLGGSSSMNAAIYHRCSPEDFAQWEKQGAVGWNYDEMKKYFVKAEKCIPRSDSRSSFASEAHGLDGYSIVTRPSAAPIMDRIIGACQNVGIPKSVDFNTDGGTLGVGYFQASVDDFGRRSSAATAYLNDGVMSRTNLTVGIDIMVEKSALAPPESPTTANGVILSKKKEGPKHGVMAKKEVILASGAVGTPLLLMHSGLGPREVLKSKRIQPVQGCNLPQIGRGLSDHLSAGPFIMRSRSEWTWDYLFTPFWTIISILQWLFFGTQSPFASLAAQGAFFVRSDDDKLPCGSGQTKTEDLTSGPKSPDIEVFFAPTIVIDNASKPPPRGEYGITFGPIILKPKSKGTVEPASSCIWDGPLINPNYLSERHDLHVLIKAARLCMRIARTEPLASCLELQNDATDATSKFWPADANPDTVTNEELEKWIIRNGSTAFHPMSTARMGLSAEDSVVDSELNVHGVSNLRIVDASVFPSTVSGHPCAVVIALAERAADIIKSKGLLEDIM